MMPGPRGRRATVVFPRVGTPWENAWRWNHGLHSPAQVFVRRCGHTRAIGVGIRIIPRRDPGRRDMGVMAIVVWCTDDGRRESWAELLD